MNTRKLRAAGAGAVVSALLITGVAHPASAQTTATAWTPGRTLEGINYHALTLVGSAEAIPNPTGSVVLTNRLGPRITRLFDLLDATPEPSLFTYNGNTGIVFNSIHQDVEFRDVGSGFWFYAEQFGDYGEYARELRYSGDGTYAPATLMEHLPISPPAGKVVPNSSVSALPGGQMGVAFDPDISGVGVFQCIALARIWEFDEYPDPVEVTVTDGQASSQCEVQDPDEPHVMAFTLRPGAAHTAHVNAMIFVPSAGGTTKDVNPDDSFAPGQSVEVQFTDLPPNEDGDTDFESSPVQLGRFTTNSAGAGSITVTIPPDATDGPHHIILRIDGVEVARKPITISAMADPARPGTLTMAPSNPGDPGDPGGPGNPSGSLTGSLGS